jgi:hypothetical protein
VISISLSIQPWQSSAILFYGTNLSGSTLNLTVNRCIKLFCLPPAVGAAGSLSPALPPAQGMTVLNLLPTRSRQGKGACVLLCV